MECIVYNGIQGWYLEVNGGWAGEEIWIFSRLDLIKKEKNGHFYGLNEIVATDAASIAPEIAKIIAPGTNDSMILAIRCLFAALLFFSCLPTVNFPVSFQSTFINIDKKGKMAAVPTRIYHPLDQSTEAWFRADHPFIFLIQDEPSGAILFMGRVVDPSV